ncbi:MAG: PAS domain-containing protein [Nitrososphaeria archaeon]
MRRLKFVTGSMTKRESEALMNALPMKITFVDRLDRIRYFNNPRNRVFSRSKDIIGEKVQKCYSEGSLHLLNKILSRFRDGARDEVRFWKKENEHIIYIRYIAVRDKDGSYVGALEVAQDITDIKKIKGERRQLRWDDP